MMTPLSTDSEQPEVQVCTGVTFSLALLLLVCHLSLPMDTNYINMTTVTAPGPCVGVFCLFSLFCLQAALFPPPPLLPSSHLLQTTTGEATCNQGLEQDKGQ